MKEQLKKDIQTLTQLISVDGSEAEVGRYIKQRLEAVCDKVEVSGMGTVTGFLKGSRPGKRAIVTAHMDEIGFIVKNITEDGFILFEKVGDFSNKVIPARKVWIQTEKGRVPGVIGLRAAHIMTPEEAGKVESTKQAYIDVGAFSKEEAQSYGIRLGDKIVLQSDFLEMSNPDLVCTKSLDNRTGCAILLQLLETIDKDALEGEIVAVFSVLEETTIAGMVSPATQIDPDYAIVLDTVPCGDVPDVNTARELPVYMDRGPVLILAQGDPDFRRYSCMHPALRRGLYDAADTLGMTLQELVISENLYITEESIMHTAGSGIPAATLAIPRRYSHTPVELLNINDAVKTAQLLKRFIEMQGGLDITFF
ncbi:M42 family metallopeptidase [Zhenpiania hominis]|uniref:M42 family metallopeptidase n=1 Tax=Zhenpiania hominis TaxID=2763644 RepID=A0A923NMF1_9FIRM|nr:M42 family metallopeptidase [Zhenpiania hominis]MBC6679847.1 M42 family metallopeptidase [Zhenpiania hominis]